MLRNLEVINYGLIDHVNLDFKKGLTAITGETGSGKSILLGAFGLLLGDRADSKSIKHIDQKCIVEAVFDLRAFQLEQFFQENDLDFDANTTVRREIAPGGKSRAFINDTPVSLQQLRALGERLVDIHSQHENSILGERSFQFSVSDAFAHHEALLADYSLNFSLYKSQKSELEKLVENEVKMKQDLDYYQFQLEELEKVSLENIDLPALEAELETLNNAEQIKSSLGNITSILDAEHPSVISGLAMAKAAAQKLASFNTTLEDFAKRIDSSMIDLRELCREIEAYADGVAMQPERIVIVQELIGQIYHLQQKHRMQSIEELIALREQIRVKVQESSSVDDRIQELRKELHQTEQTLGLIADKLTASRQKGGQKATKEVEKYFKELSLDHAELVFDLTPSKSFHAQGKDDIQILFRSNKGGQLLPIKQVASGGEISRVMLALKAAIARHKKLPVLILDEIDQGVSGEVGKKIGSILKEMSSDMQLITITHLPQIAGKAEHHLKVSKETDGKTTTTKVEILNQDERIQEIAEMLSGKNFTKAALENAKELMN
jgi:DNA repair protein RecN (Recombination protein N)